ACWEGRVTEVLAELAAWQVRLGRPPPEAEALDPRQLVQEALTYLRNNAPRMDYPRYRRQGLPVTSSWVESLVGEFNARVKRWVAGRQPRGGVPRGVGAKPCYNATGLSRGGSGHATAGPLQPTPEPHPPLTRLPRGLGCRHGPAAQPRSPATRLLCRPTRRTR